MIYTGIGSRDTPTEICALMTRIAKYMAAKGYTLRSGGAPGADTAFEMGADQRKEIYLPWKAFNNNPSELFPASDAAMKIAAEFHPYWGKLSQRSKLLIGRNTHQVLGADCNASTERIICWTKDAKGGGGTGQAIRIARHLGIPIDDLANPMLLKAWQELLIP